MTNKKPPAYVERQEGTVFAGVCLSTHWGEGCTLARSQMGVPQPGPRWGYPSQVMNGWVPWPGPRWRYPDQVPDKGYPARSQMGHPSQVRMGGILARDGVPLPHPEMGYPHQGWGTPQPGMGTPLHPEMGSPQPGMGYPPPIQRRGTPWDRTADRWSTWYTAGCCLLRSRRRTCF